MRKWTAALWMLITVSLCVGLAADAPKTARRGKKGGGAPAAAAVKLEQPLAWGPDFVEVTADHTLRRRCRVWGDWDKNLASYMAEARANAAARGTPARKLTLACIFLKDAQISFPNIAGSDGKPLQAVYTTPAEVVTKMRDHTTKEYSDFIFAFSGGEVEVQWIFETLEGIHWVQPGKSTEWGCQPKVAAAELERALAKHKRDQVCMWVFCAGGPQALNAGSGQKVHGIGGGISYTQWQLLGGYSLVTSVPELGFLVHEVSHRYLDNLPAIEGLRLTMFHGLANLGYEGDDCNFPRLLNTYSSVYRYIVRPAMWRRFTVNSTNHTPHEPFSGRAYAWADVQADCWFMLPELHDAELAKLTGLKTFHMDAADKTRYRLYTVAPAERAQVRSPYVDSGSENDTRLNNLISLNTESCAVLATAGGIWLFVRPDLADVYVDMARVAGRPGAPLPVYGYVLEGVRPLVVLKAPAELPLPTHELGFFRSF